MRYVFGLFLCLMCGPVFAESQWHFGDWSVTVKEADADTVLRRTCTASTGGNGQPQIFIRVREGEPAPPWRYPTPIFGEYAPRGTPMRMRPGDSVSFGFSGGMRASVSLKTGLHRDSLAFAHARPRPFDVPWMLKAMRAGDSMSIYRSGPGRHGQERVFRASLSGFTSAYLKMLELCGQGGHSPAVSAGLSSSDA